MVGQKIKGSCSDCFFSLGQMQAYRIRAIPRVCCPRATLTAPPSARNMGTFFPHFPPHPFALLSRDLDSLFPSENLWPQHRLRPFVPKADVREDHAAYTLGLELPGLKQEDINIEFVDANTLVIAGKTEQASTRSNVAGTIEKAAEGASSPPNTNTADNASETSSNYHKATVEDDYVDAGAEKDGASTATQGAPTPASTSATEVASTPKQPGSRYWVTERSVGEFRRTFSFPGKVDQEAVKASLENGILSVVVPKTAKQQRKIVIE
ncbi:MAG: hypothetical protein Q9169_001815 [Polycauliona sp. 2 TL-2023]